MQAVVEELELVKCLDTVIGGAEVLYHVKVPNHTCKLSCTILFWDGNGCIYTGGFSLPRPSACPVDVACLLLYVAHHSPLS